MAAPQTPESELSDQLQETLKLARKGLTAPEISKKRKVTSSAVYGAFRRLEELGYASDLPERNGRGNGSNGKVDEPRTAVEQVLHTLEAQRTTIEKRIENTRQEADDHDAKAAELRGQADAMDGELRILKDMEAAAA